MIDPKRIEVLAEEAIGDSPELFIVAVHVGPDNDIKVFADGDQGIKLQQCVAISRHIEHNLDRQAVDFSLEVSSPGGMKNPLENPRSLNKFKGKTIRIHTENRTFEGAVAGIGERGLVLEWEARVSKPVGKGKITVTQSQTFDLKAIQRVDLIPAPRPND